MAHFDAETLYLWPTLPAYSDFSRSILLNVNCSSYSCRHLSSHWMLGLGPPWGSVSPCTPAATVVSAESLPKCLSAGCTPLGEGTSVL